LGVQRRVGKPLSTDQLAVHRRVVDAGMDISGVESSMAVLKDMARTQQKNIFLISHKDELVSRVNSVLKVIKENGFTNYANDVDIIV
jgi:hypothetical protein